MATRAGVSTWVSKRVLRTVWSGLLTTDDGTAESTGRLSDRSVQVSGTFGVNADVTIQGSNDGTNWVTLSDPQGNPLVFDAAALEEILENTQFIRPVVVAGDGTTNVTVTLVSASTA